MRYLTFILSIFFLVLSVLPCTDGQDVFDDVHKEHQQSSGHSHDQEGDCPPFCSCSCCGVSLTVLEVELLPIPFFRASFATEFYYSFDYFYQYPKVVWQPPTNGSVFNV